MHYNRLVNQFGLRSKTMDDLERRLTHHLLSRRRGPRLRRSARFILVVTLMRLRSALALRLLRVSS